MFFEVMIILVSLSSLIEVVEPQVLQLRGW